MAKTGIGAAGGDARPAGWPERIAGRRGIILNFFLILPLLVVYEIGIRTAGFDQRNAAEVILKDIYLLMGSNYARYAHWLIAAAIILCYLRTASDERSFFFVFGTVLIESAFLALFLGPLLSCTLGGVLRHNLLAAPGGDGLHSSLMLSIGAGVYEEIVFRLFLLGGIFALMHHVFRASLLVSAATGLVVSALLFAYYHHMGPYGEPFAAPVFAFRAAAGVILGLVFIFRGFGVAVYVHAFYDVFHDIETALRGG